MRHLTILRYIAKIAETGSLRSAAEELGITPSALNRRILAVEQELGVEIFERHPAGMRPNIAGEILLDHIRTQLADMERVRSRIADLSGMRAGHVNIATTREMALYFLPDLIRRHLAEFPAVSFDVNLMARGEAEAALADLSADIAIVFEPIHKRDLQAVYRGSQPIYCVMADDHPLAGREQLKIYDCIDYPLLLPKRPEGIRTVLDQAAERVGITLEPVLESNSLDLLRLMSQDSAALSFSLAVNLRPDLARDRLRAVPVELGKGGAGTLVAGHLPGRALPVAAARFLEAVARELGQRYS